MFTCTFLIRPGAPTPPMYTEVMPGGQLLALIIPSLTETMAGTYYCSGSYANTEPLEASVDIQTFGELNFGFVNLYLNVHFEKVFMQINCLLISNSCNYMEKCTGIPVSSCGQGSRYSM